MKIALVVVFFYYNTKLSLQKFALFQTRRYTLVIISWDELYQSHKMNHKNFVKEIKNMGLPWEVTHYKRPLLNGGFERDIEIGDIYLSIKSDYSGVWFYSNLLSSGSRPSKFRSLNEWYNQVLENYALLCYYEKWN